jgi:hypothetical protein
VGTRRGLVTNYVFFVIHHATRMVTIAGITPNPDGNFMGKDARIDRMRRPKIVFR